MSAKKIKNKRKNLKKVEEMLNKGGAEIKRNREKKYKGSERNQKISKLLWEDCKE
jgi:predicted Ser/Thr protein kinase